MSRKQIFRRAFCFRRIVRWLIGGNVVLAATTVNAVDSSGKEQGLGQTVDAFITPFVESGSFGGAVLIARGEEVLISKGYGMANLEHGVPNTPQTRFRLGSLTKQFTAMAILMLQEQGQLDVQDPICDYVTDCPEAWRSIIIHHLLAHASGIPNFTEFLDYSETMALKSDVVETISRFRNKPLDFEPGTHFCYSNSGYIVLGYIIKKIAGTDYDQFLQENIFQPLGMLDTGYDHPGLVLKHRASGYRDMGNGKYKRAAYVHMSLPYAAGGLYSTVEDLYRWDRALYTETLVSQPSLELMFTPHAQDYGYGWRIRKGPNGTSIGHTGEISGFTTFIGRFVDDDVVVIVLSNIENAPFDEIIPGLIARALRKHT